MPPPAVHGCVDVSLGLVGLGNVGHGVAGGVLANRPHGFLESRFVEVDQRQARALFGEEPRRSLADTTRGPCNQGHLSFKTRHVQSPFVGGFDLPRCFSHRLCQSGEPWNPSGWQNSPRHW